MRPHDNARSEEVEDTPSSGDNGNASQSKRFKKECLDVFTINLKIPDQISTSGRYSVSCMLCGSA